VFIYDKLFQTCPYYDIVFWHETNILIYLWTIIVLQNKINIWQTILLLKMSTYGLTKIRVRLFKPLG